MTRPGIHVVAGVLVDTQGRVLVAQRGSGKHLAGTWEFPGGKVDPGEDPRTALRRELGEELGIETGAVEPLIGVPWCYPDKTIFLDAYRVLDYAGVPQGREDQSLAWHRVGALATLEMPPPDRPIVNALRLPTRYAITPEPDVDDAEFVQRAERVIVDGARLLQLRAKHIDAARLRELAHALRKITQMHGAQLILNGSAVNGSSELASECAVDGVHLSSSDLLRAASRPLGPGQWVAASCHDEREIHKANALGIDFGVLGPVAATDSHPGVPPLGWTRFAELCALAAFPVFALGGLRPDDIGRARASGAQGIAGISAFFGQRQVVDQRPATQATSVAVLTLQAWRWRAARGRAVEPMQARHHRRKVRR